MADEQTESIDNILNDFSDLLETPAPQAPASPQAQEKAPEPVQATPEPEAATPQPALSPLLAKHAEEERKLREQLAAVEQATESRVKQTKEEAFQEFLANPREFAEKNQISQEQAYNLALNYYALALGDDAPDELKKEIGMTETDLQIKQMKQEMESWKQQMQLEKQQAQLQVIADQYQGFIASAPESLPYFAAEAGHSSSDMYATMAQAADHIAQQTGKYPSAMEVAQLIEENLSAVATRLSGINQPPTTPQVVQTPKPTQTLSTEHNVDSTPKDAPEGEDELYEDAMKWMEQHYKPLR